MILQLEVQVKLLLKTILQVKLVLKKFSIFDSGWINLETKANANANANTK
jgi:hypothetical protein